MILFRWTTYTLKLLSLQLKIHPVSHDNQIDNIHTQTPLLATQDPISQKLALRPQVFIHPRTAHDQKAIEIHSNLLDVGWLNCSNGERPGTAVLGLKLLHHPPQIAASEENQIK